MHKRSKKVCMAYTATSTLLAGLGNCRPQRSSNADFEQAISQFTREIDFGKVISSKHRRAPRSFHHNRFPATKARAELEFMAHAVNCKLLQSYRQWHTFQAQSEPLDRDTSRRSRVWCKSGNHPGTQVAHRALQRPLLTHCQSDHVPAGVGELNEDTTATPNTRRAILQAGTASIGKRISRVMKCTTLCLDSASKVDVLQYRCAAAVEGSSCRSSRVQKGMLQEQFDKGPAAYSVSKLQILLSNAAGIEAASGLPRPDT